MNCFYHTEEPSVAACIDCGKGLCKECTGRYEIPICNECNEKRSKAEKQAIFRQYIPSALLFIAGFLVGNGTKNPIIASLFYGYLFAGILWGWKVITFIQPKMFLFLSFAGWILYFMLKFMLALFVGIVAMPIGIVRIILKHINAQSKGENIRNNINQT